MFPEIIQTSTYVLHILRCHRTGLVHSAYRKTINLSTGDTILALQAHDSALSPASLLTNLSAAEMAGLRPLPGEPVTLTPSSVEIPTESGHSAFCIKEGRCEIMDMHLHALTGPDEAAAFSAALKPVITSTGAGGFSRLFTRTEDIGDDPLLGAAGRIIQSAGILYAHREWTAAADTLIRLIGLGSGLTPGGDDFLCGVLAGLILKDQADHPFGQALRWGIAHHLSDTVDISRVFLCLALEGQFSLPVLSLSSLNLNQKNLTGSLCSSFERIGHSSGMDTLCGIYFITSEDCGKTPFQSGLF